MSAQAESPDINTEPVKDNRIIQESSRELNIRRLKMLAPLWTLMIMLLFFSLASPSFATPANFNNIASQIATAGILAVGMTFVLLTGEIDLSVAAVMALSAEIMAQLYANYHYPEPIPLIAGLLTGLLCGIGSGLISTVIRVPTFMATFAMSLIATGLTLWISQGRQFFTDKISPVALWIGSAKIGGSNGIVAMGGSGGMRQGFMIVLMMLCLLIAYLVLRYTRFGRYVYMAGANPSAARLAGINTKLMVFSVLAISGFTAALAGIAAMGRLGTALPAPQNDFLIDAIAVVVLGGTSLTGGRGGILQTVVGLLIYGSLRNGLDNIANIDSLAKTFITGLVLLAALIINVVFAGRAERDRT
jgi:ribose transport system permease protein